MKVLITGGAGFIGSHLVEAMLVRGHRVTVVDDLSTGRRESVLGGARFYEADIVDWDCGCKYDLIYHCAASYADRSAWERDARTNVLGTISVVRLAQRTGARLVYFQTSLCYGQTPPTPATVDAPLVPVGSYAVSKTAGEAYIRDSGVPWVSLRLANVYGPRNLSGPVPAFYKRLSAGEPCTVVDARRDFVYIDDLVRLAIHVDLLADVADGVYHVSTGQDVAVADIYSAVATELGLDPTPPPLTPRTPDDAATILIDPSATTAVYGWHAQTPLYLGIRSAVDWYREHGVERTFTHLAVKG